MKLKKYLFVLLKLTEINPSSSIFLSREEGLSKEVCFQLGLLVGSYFSQSHKMLLNSILPQDSQKGRYHSSISQAYAELQNIVSNISLNPPTSYEVSPCQPLLKTGEIKKFKSTSHNLASVKFKITQLRPSSFHCPFCAHVRMLRKETWCV